MVDTENISHFSWCKASHRRVSHSLPLLVPLYQLVAVPPARHQPFSLCHFANTGLGIWSWWRELNPQPALYKSAALPVELHQHYWWAGKDSNLRHPAPKAIKNCCSTILTRVDYFTALFQLSYPPIIAAFSEEQQPLNRKGKQEKSKNLKNLIARLKLSIIFIHFIFTSIKK